MKNKTPEKIETWISVVVNVRAPSYAKTEFGHRGLKRAPDDLRVLWA